LVVSPSELKDLEEKEVVEVDASDLQIQGATTNEESQTKIGKDGRR
jgi:hypothetical protein